MEIKVQKDVSIQIDKQKGGNPYEETCICSSDDVAALDKLKYSVRKGVAGTLYNLRGQADKEITCSGRWNP